MFCVVPRAVRTLADSSTLHRLLAQALCPVRYTEVFSLPTVPQAALRLEALLHQLPRPPHLMLHQWLLHRLKHLP